MEFFLDRYGDKYTDIKHLAGKWDQISLYLKLDFNTSFFLSPSDVDPVADRLVNWLPFLLEHLNYFINRFITISVFDFLNNYEITIKSSLKRNFIYK